MRGCHSPRIGWITAPVELTAIDPYPAAEAAADIEGGFDNDVVG
jgi:hypothetical protein